MSKATVPASEPRSYWNCPTNSSHFNMKTPYIDKNLRILVVDDNRSIHDDFRKILAEEKDAHSALAVEAALFGETTEMRHAVHFELESAYQGEEGFEMVKRAVADGRP